MTVHLGKFISSPYVTELRFGILSFQQGHCNYQGNCNVVLLLCEHLLKLERQPLEITNVLQFPSNSILVFIYFGYKHKYFVTLANFIRKMKRAFLCSYYFIRVQSYFLYCLLCKHICLLSFISLNPLVLSQASN